MSKAERVALKPSRVSDLYASLSPPRSPRHPKFVDVQNWKESRRNVDEKPGERKVETYERHFVDRTRPVSVNFSPNSSMSTTASYKVPVHLDALSECSNSKSFTIRSDGLGEEELDAIRNVDDTFNRTLITTDENTGERIMKVTFDVSGFSSKDIKVKANAQNVQVIAKKEDSGYNERSTKEYTRNVQLPPEADHSRIKCSKSGRSLTVEIPIIDKSNIKPPELNSPTIVKDKEGSKWELLADVGHFFDADEIVVKYKSGNILQIQAEHIENGSTDKMKASLLREFHINRRIIPRSIKAGLTGSGQLKVSAKVRDDSF
ncbi:unnamed protein product [Dimorphilus gyrociliatus]|nr:unnamed protein product [Dimorphilus gyrociliatus]